MRAPTLVILGAAAVLGVAPPGCREDPAPPPDGPPAVRTSISAAPSKATYSNILAGDYVGPSACAECHEEIHAQWRAHPHSRMNQDATPQSVIGDFSSVSAEYGGVTTTFERDGDAFFMTHRVDGVALRKDRITRTIGSKLQQAYVGIQVEGPEPPEHPLYRTERALPYVYWLSRRAWFPEHYVEQYPEAEYDEAGELRYPTGDPYSRGTRPWSEGCLLCHDTYPYAFRLVRDFPGRGFAGVQAIAGAPGLPAAGPFADDLVTLGISCESCHFGGREHVEHEREVFDAPSSPILASTADLEGGAAVNSVCAQCHVAGTLPHPNGASSVNSSEALDMLQGACASRIGCTDCHDPHTGRVGEMEPKSTRALSLRDESSALQACGNCHPRLASEEGRSQHARHTKEQASCLDCHMAPMTQGIDTVVRSHRIDVPTNRDMLADGAPNACNLCHLDRSLSWTLQQWRSGWNVRVEPQPRWTRHYGDDLQRPLGEVWLDHETPAYRLLAAAAYGRRGADRRQLRRLLDVLMDPFPNNRMFALFAVESIVGRRLEATEYTPTASPMVRRRQIETLARTLRPKARPNAVEGPRAH